MSFCNITNVWRMVYVLTLLTFVFRANAVDSVGETSWSFYLPKDDKVVYRGLVSFDDAGKNSGQMLYASPNAAGFLAAILTHGVIVESQKKNQKDQLQVEADNVLVPYQTILGDYLHKDLMQNGLQKISMGGKKELIELTEKSNSDWLIYSSPIFLLTQDQSAIVLENAISIYAPGAPETSAYQNIIRVVSEPKEDKDLVNLWTNNQGEKLKDESASLFARSIEISMNDMVSSTDNDNIPQKTFRYYQGQDKKVERGYLISENCNRMVIKSLRGQLISIPSHNDSSSDEHCEQ